MGLCGRPAELHWGRRREGQSQGAPERKLPFLLCPLSSDLPTLFYTTCSFYDLSLSI